MRHARFAQHLPAFLAGTVICLGSISRVSAQFTEPGLVVIHTLTGDGAGEFFGYVANRVADVDADGADDMLVGAPYASFAAANTGRMYLISGASGARLAVIDGITNEYLGNAVDDAGDVNGDGLHDLIGGSPGLPFSGTPGVNGRVSVYSGAPPYGLIWSRVGENLNDRFGSAVAGLQDDFNEDGLNDVLATAALYDGPAGVNSGRAYILSGLDGSTLLTLEGLAAGGLHGTAIASMDDLDNDGLRDVAVGARNDGLPQRRGLAYIYSGLRGTAVVRTCAPLASGVDLGWFFMNSLGDANADGLADLYVSDFGDVGHGAGTGRAYLFSGADGSLIRHWVGRSAGQGFGIGRAVGDLDGDGYAELFMGAWIGDVGAANAGEGYVLSSRTGNVLQTMTCNVANTNAGFDAFGLNDVDNDGKADFGITGNGTDAASIARFDGVVYVLGGKVAPPPAGDMNCDGVVSVSDIGGFVLALTDPAQYAIQYPDCSLLAADVNHDLAVSVSDIGPFVMLLTGA